MVGKPGETVSGELVLSAHSRQSYDVHVTLRALSAVPSLVNNNNGIDNTINTNSQVQESKGTFDLKDPYYRQLNQGWGQQQQQPSSTIAAEDYSNGNGGHYYTTNGTTSNEENPQQQQQPAHHHENGVGGVILTPQSNGVRMMMMGGHEV